MMVLLLSGLSVSVPGLERALHHYTLSPSETPFDIKTVPIETQPMAEQKTICKFGLPQAHLLTTLIVNRNHFWKQISYAECLKKLTVLNNLPYKNCETFLGNFSMYGWLKVSSTKKL